MINLCMILFIIYIITLTRKKNETKMLYNIGTGVINYILCHTKTPKDFSRKSNRKLCYII